MHLIISSNTDAIDSYIYNYLYMYIYICNFYRNILSYNLVKKKYM